MTYRSNTVKNEPSHEEYSERQHGNIYNAPYQAYSDNSVVLDDSSIDIRRQDPDVTSEFPSSKKTLQQSSNNKVANNDSLPNLNDRTRPQSVLQSPKSPAPEPKSTGGCCLGKKKKKVDKNIPAWKRKKFKNLTKDEKKERMNYLWNKVRAHFKTKIFLNIAGQMADEQANQDMMGQDLSFKSGLNTNIELDLDTQLNWYQIDTTKTSAQLWQFIINCLTVYTLSTIPFTIVFGMHGTTLEQIIMLAIDSIFALDFVFTFFKTVPEIPQLKISVINYVTGRMFFDLASFLPGLITLENENYLAAKIFRMANINLIFIQMEFIFHLFLYSKGFNKKKIEGVTDLIKIITFTMLFAHLMACLWLYIGYSDEQEGWVYINDDFDPENHWHIYIFSFYWVIEVITTVGYGDYSGSTTYEYIYSMGLMFCGLSFFSFLMSTVSTMATSSDKFDDLINEKLEGLDVWIKKIERSNKPKHIEPKLYLQIKQYVHDAFLHDFNLIIEEFPFYTQLPPQLQTQVVHKIFDDFKSNDFNHFFDGMEKGFQNEIIVNLYARIYLPNREVISYGQTFNEMFFVREGSVLFYNKFKLKEFLALPKRSFFGDYQIMYGLKSNVAIKTNNRTKHDTMFMCVKAKTLLDICDLFPNSAKNLKQRALHRRFAVIQELQNLDSQTKDDRLKAMPKSNIWNYFIEDQLRTNSARLRTNFYVDNPIDFFSLEEEVKEAVLNDFYPDEIDEEGDDDNQLNSLRQIGNKVRALQNGLERFEKNLEENVLKFKNVFSPQQKKELQNLNQGIRFSNSIRGALSAQIAASVQSKNKSNKLDLLLPQDPIKEYGFLQMQSFQVQPARGITSDMDINDDEVKSAQIKILANFKIVNNREDDLDQMINELKSDK